MARERMTPARCTKRVTGASLSNDRCVLMSLYNTTTERPRDRGVRASLSVASLGRITFLRMERVSAGIGPRTALIPSFDVNRATPQLVRAQDAGFLASLAHGWE